MNDRIRHDYARHFEARDPVETGDTVAHAILGFLALFGMCFLLFWLASGQ
jgi:hypothetical protein